MDKLELKHLAPYLPYGLKVKIWGKIKTMTIFSSFDENEIGISSVIVDSMKPILHPLSDLTKEIEHNREKFVPIEIINRINSRWSINAGIFNERVSKNLNIIHTEPIGSLPYWICQKLFEWHFDVGGLIEKGLAIDMNTLTTKQK